MAEKDTNNKKPTRTEIKEIGRVAALERLFKDTGYTNSVVQEQGDDGYNYLTTNALFLEGIDFDLSYIPMEYLGYKAVINAVGPLYSMCYKPYQLSFVIALSGKFSFEHLDWLWAGVRAGAKGHGIANVTLDLTSSLTGLSISCTAVGRQKKEAQKLIRKPAKNSLICVTGNLGAAYMGLHVLQREKAAFSGRQPDLSKYKYIVGQYLTPQIDSDIIEQFDAAGFYPSAGYFLRRGLGDGVKQLCHDTGLGAKVFIEKIPIATQTREMAEEINMDVVTAVVNGGDDYKMLYVIPLKKHDAFVKEFKEADVIGHLSDEGCYLITPEGNQIEIKAQGWQ